MAERGCFDTTMALQTAVARRQFLGRQMMGPGVLALAGLLGDKAAAGAFENSAVNAASGTGLPGLPHLIARANRVIWLTQAGAPSQLDLFDYKPQLRERFNTDLPNSVRGEQRLTGMTAGAAALPGVPLGVSIRAAWCRWDVVE